MARRQTTERSEDVEVIVGEVHTGLLLNSAPVASAPAARLLQLVLGEHVWRSERPTAYARSPTALTGVDCRLLDRQGAKVHGVGTVAHRAVLTGGHVLQGSAFARIRRGTATSRRPWSHYLGHAGVIETIGKADPLAIAAGFVDAPAQTGQLDLGTISDHAMDLVQRHPSLDRQAAFPSSRISLRWSWAPTLARPSVSFAVAGPTSRTVRLLLAAATATEVAQLCEDLALHDWLLTTVLGLIERSQIGVVGRSDVVQRLRPAVDYLLHLWMPGSRESEVLSDVWPAIDLRTGMSRQWNAAVDRIRNQLALTTIESLHSSLGRPSP